MSGNRQFVDTNVLVYAHDVTAGDKHRRARALVSDLWQTRAGCLSVQVLQEFFVTTTRQIPKPLDVPAAARIIDDLAHWHVHAPAAADVLAAIGIHQRTSTSFWDAMILRSAKELGCETLHSEDLNPGQLYEGVQVRNPFLA
jgi:predicted nucleic acid-binding protein